MRLLILVFCSRFRLTIKATCNMNLANFPMDDQLCTVEVESFGYTMADLR